MKTVVVVPTYNEAENIPLLLPRILEQGLDVEVLVVDDNSPDGTGRIVGQLAASDPRIHVLHRQQKQGLGPSYVAGFKWALDYGAELIVQMDADFSHDPNQLPDFFKEIEEVDLVIGSRYIKGGCTHNWPVVRKLISRTGSLYTRAILGIDMKDITGGFKCFRRKVLESIDLTNVSAKGYAFQIEMTYRALQSGFRVKEIPITFVDRVWGESKMTGGIAFEAMVLLWKLRFSNATKPETALIKEGETNMPSLDFRQGNRILMVVSEAPPIKSGVGKVIGELKEGLERKGHHVDVLSSLDIPRYNFGEIRLSTFIFHWWKLRRTLDQYDLINVHAPAPTFADLFLLLSTKFGLSRRKNRIVMTYHCEIDLPGAVFGPLTQWYSHWHKRLAKLVSHTIVTTPSYADMFEGVVSKDKLSIIPWGVNSNIFGTEIVNKTQETFRVAFVGQMRPYKGLDVLLHAVEGLSGVELTVIGKGHHADHFKQLAKQLALPNIAFLGPVSDEELQRVLKESHVLVLPSRTKAEAFGIVLVESMAAGCIPVASDLPGVRDVVGQVGFTFPTGDSDKLREVLRHLSANPELVEKQGLVAQTSARHYTWQRCVDAHDRLFRKIVTQKAVAPKAVAPVYNIPELMQPPPTELVGISISGPTLR